MKYLKLIAIALALLSIVIGCANNKPVSRPTRSIVDRVIDGDSFTMSNENEVRLIGIDAPEWNEPGGDIAKAYLEGLILGKELRFKLGAENKDFYNRLLRYVFVGKTFVNGEMVKNGYAICRYDSKEKKYKKQMRRFQKDAEEYKRGLWTFGTVFQSTKTKAGTKEKWIPWESAKKHIGENKTVEGIVTKTDHTKKVCRLYFAAKNKGKFRVVIFPENYGKFPDSPWKYYNKKKVRITGLIKKSRYGPNIEVISPEQIEVMK